MTPPESTQVPFHFSHSYHPRNSELGQFIYPVNSRRAKGLSLGININPDKKCSFDCSYCQVIRTTKTTSIPITLDQVLNELQIWLEKMQHGKHIGHTLKDISIAGDGEPTQVKFLPELIPEIIQMRDGFGFKDRKLILFTNGTKIDRPDLQPALKLMGDSNGEIWIKLDFWDQSSLQVINRSKIKIDRLKAKLINVSQINPVVVQSCFFKGNQQKYADSYYQPFVQNLKNMVAEGFCINRIQVYTLARLPADSTLHPWDRDTMDRIGKLIQTECSIKTEVFYGSEEF